MAILSMVLLMADLLAKDAPMKADLMSSSFGTPFDCSHDGLI